MTTQQDYKEMYEQAIKDLTNERNINERLREEKTIKKSANELTYLFYFLIICFILALVIYT